MISNIWGFFLFLVNLNSITFLNSPPLAKKMRSCVLKLKIALICERLETNFIDNFRFPKFRSVFTWISLQSDVGKSSYLCETKRCYLASRARLPGCLYVLRGLWESKPFLSKKIWKKLNLLIDFFWFFEPQIERWNRVFSTTVWAGDTMKALCTSRNHLGSLIFWFSKFQKNQKNQNSGNPEARVWT